jgi:putative DNA primase/helicase
MTHVEIAVFRKHKGALSKKIWLDRDGKVCSDGSGCRMALGEGWRVRLNGVKSLADLIERTRTNEALVLGRLRADLPDQVDVVPARELGRNPPDNVIARTGEYLHFAAGAPAYLLLDHDRKGQPAAVATRMKAAGGFWEAVIAAVPALAGAAYVRRRSTSAGLYHEVSNEWLSGSAGEHIYVAVSDGADIERALKTLHERLWLAGMGYYVVGAAGQLLDRSIIDAAVYGPERLVFEGAPELEPPVAQDRDVRRPRVHDGDIIDTAAVIRPLSEKEAVQLARLKGEARDRLKPQVAETRKLWAQEFADRHGMSEAEAEQIAADATRHRLDPAFELEFDEHGKCTVADVLADPDRYVGESLADPLEGVAYGRGKAKVFQRSDGQLMINSFAHGGIKYQLAGQDERENSSRELPVIQVVSGEIARAVDEAQDAILTARLNIFVRGGGVLVEPREREKEAADKRRVKTTILVMTPKPRLAYLINKRAAAFEKYDGRRNDWVRIDPPDKVTEMLLTLGDWKFPEVTGVVSAPTLRPDGSILSQYGYDPATRLWCDSTLTLPDIPERPSRSWAEKSLQLYKELLAGFPFVSKVDRAVALSAIMTTVLRGAYSLVPLFLIVAHDPGTGKSYLVDVIASIITGRWCPVITPGKDSEEMEKRLGAVLLEGGAIVSLDNLDFNLEGAMLNQMLSQPVVKVRPLGQSAVPECEWRGTLFATGNNVRAVGDLVRRVLTCNMDAKMERPEQRRFEFKPITRVLNNRASFIAAAIIIARAYRASNRPASNCVSLGGYEDWSEWVREPLLWLGEADPVESMDAARASDPARAAARELLERWRRVIGMGKAVSVRQIIGIANEDNRNGLHRYPEFRSFLIEHAGTPRGDAIDPLRLGHWLQQEHGRVYDGLRIDMVQHKGRANDYVLVKCDSGAATI